MLLMVIEHFKNRDAKAVCGRPRKKERLSPEGLRSMGKQIRPNFYRCFQLMECTLAEPDQI